MNTFKEILFDILHLYRHFLAWNIHKLITHAVGVLCAILIALVFFVLYYLIASLFAFGETNLYYAFYTPPSSEAALFSIISMVFIVIAFVFSHQLLIERYKLGFAREKVSFFQFKNIGVRFFGKYFLLTTGVGVVFGLFVWGFLLTVKAFLGDLYMDLGGFAFYSLALATVFLLLFYYLFFRLGFAYFYLSSHSVLAALKASFFSTRGVKKFLQTTAALALFLLPLVPFHGLQRSITDEQAMLSSYMILQAQTRDDVQELEFQRLALRYEELDASEQSRVLRSLFTADKLLSVLWFLLFTGYATKLWTSIFIRIIEKK